MICYIPDQCPTHKYCTTKRIEKQIGVNEMRMRGENQERTHIRDNGSGAGFQKEHGETIERLWACDACQRDMKRSWLRAGEEMDMDT